MLRFVTFAIAFCAVALSGAWWQGGDRRAAVSAVMFAAFMVAVGSLSGCAPAATLYHACRDGLCR